MTTRAVGVIDDSMLHRCRCCLRRPPDRPLATPYTHLGHTEIYSDMLKECFDLQVSEVGEMCGICEVCVGRLRDASAFKLQVQRCQAELLVRLQSQAQARLWGAPRACDEPVVKLEMPDNEIIVKVEIPDISEDLLNSDPLRLEPEDKTCEGIPLVPTDRASKNTSHQSAHTQSTTKKHSCYYCEKQFKRSYHLKQHLTTHTGARPYGCDICKKSFKTKNVLRAHLKIHSETKQERPHACYVCKKKFTELSRLRLHAKIHLGQNHGEREDVSEEPKVKKVPDIDIVAYGSTRQTETADEANASDQQAELPRSPSLPLENPKIEKDDGLQVPPHRIASMRIQDPRRKHCCQICQKKFKRAEHLKIHILTHTESRPYSCEICKKNFKTQRVLDVHIKIHTETIEERSHTCEICNKTFLSLSRLKIHTRIHSGELYTCEICCKPFTLLSSLELHKRVHTGERPYQCDICKLRFKQSGDLKMHIRIHMQEKPFSCGFCDKKFTRSSHLKEHERCHTGDKPYSCEMCDKRFRQLSNLKRHLGTHDKQ